MISNDRFGINRMFKRFYPAIWPIEHFFVDFHLKQLERSKSRLLQAVSTILSCKMSHRSKKLARLCSKSQMLREFVCVSVIDTISVVISFSCLLFAFWNLTFWESGSLRAKYLVGYGHLNLSFDLPLP